MDICTMYMQSTGISFIGVIKDLIWEFIEWTCYVVMSY